MEQWFHTELLHRFKIRYHYSKYPGMSAPFIEYKHGYNCATDGKALVITKSSWPVDSPTLETPDVSSIIDQIMYSVAEGKQAPLLINDIPPPTYTRSWCAMCLAQGCDECNELGYEMELDFEKACIWLPYEGEYYLFSTELLHQLRDCTLITTTSKKHAIRFSVTKTHHGKDMGVFSFDGGHAAIMCVDPGDSREIVFPAKPITVKKG